MWPSHAAPERIDPENCEKSNKKGGKGVRTESGVISNNFNIKSLDVQEATGLHKEICWSWHCFVWVGGYCLVLALCLTSQSDSAAELEVSPGIPEQWRQWGGDELTNRSQYREYLPLSLYYIPRTYEVPGCDTSYFSSVPVG